MRQKETDSENAGERARFLHDDIDLSPGNRELELSIVVPTFNEVENVHDLIERLDDTLAGTSWELIVVDYNSPDGTAEEVRKVARKDPRIRCLKRIGRRGLSSACIEGVLASSASVVAVMDADLQHDERLLPRMFGVIKNENLDLVVGSRSRQRRRSRRSTACCRNIDVRRTADGHGDRTASDRRVVDVRLGRRIDLIESNRAGGARRPGERQSAGHRIDVRRVAGRDRD